jgi:hypothetical protein
MIQRLLAEQSRIYRKAASLCSYEFQIRDNINGTHRRDLVAMRNIQRMSLKFEVFTAVTMKKSHTAYNPRRHHSSMYLNFPNVYGSG